MKVTVKLFATFRDGRQKVYDMDLPEPVPVASILEKLGIHESEIAILIVNGKDAKPETVLCENDVVALFPPVGGG
ncbi:MAG: MoaD/ThiS family protein [Bacillota bacterium]